MTDPINTTDLNQANYLKLFMQELTYQDPLKPIDNREFMAQMAQFSALQQAAATNENLTRLLGMNSANQGLSLLGKVVKIKNAEGEGTVHAVKFYDNNPPKVSVSLGKGEISDVDLSQIIEVRD